MRKLLLSFIALFTLSIVVAGCGGGQEDAGTTDEGTTDSSEETVTILANSVWPEDNHISQGMLEFSEKVKEASDGRLVIEVNTGGALGYDGPELLKAVRDNNVTISDVLLSEVAGDELLFGISTLPFLTQNFDEGKTFIDIARPYYEETAEEKWNQKILFGGSWPYAGFWTQDPVESIEDINGLKMRTYDENGATVVQAAGGTPSPLPFSEVYSSLSTGVIDSVMTSSPTAVDAKFWEVLDYYVPTNVTAAYSIISMNLDEFNKLDPELQDILVEVGQEMDDIMWEKNLSLDEEMEAKVIEEGIEILEPSQDFMDDWSSIGEEIADKWLEEAPAEAQEIVDKLYEELGR